jgi:hypothetical protein
MIVLLLFLQKQNLANAIYLFGLGTLLSGLGLKHMRIRSHHDLAGTLVTPYPWEDHGGVLRLLPVYPSHSSLLQVTSTDVAFPPFCRSCPCDRHDLYLPSIPASLQTLGRCECAAACALAPLGVRIISPRTSYRSFSELSGPLFSSDLSLIFIHRHTPDIYIYIYTCIHIFTNIYIYTTAAS